EPILLHYPSEDRSIMGNQHSHIDGNDYFTIVLDDSLKILTQSSPSLRQSRDEGFHRDEIINQRRHLGDSQHIFVTPQLNHGKNRLELDVTIFKAESLRRRRAARYLQNLHRGRV